MPAELFSRWFGRLRRMVRRSAVERSMGEEMCHHIECETEDRIRLGMTPEEARRTALRDFGGLERFKEEARDASGTRGLEDLLLDIKYARRVLRRNPAFTAAGALTFALGTAAATAVFSVVYGVVLRPLPYSDPERLVVLWEHNLRRNHRQNVVSMENFEAWRARSRSFEGMAALMPTSVTLADRDVPERILGADVSPGYFSLLGTPPAIGRDFIEADVGPGALAVIVSDAFWRQRLGADPDVAGRTIRLSEKNYTVVGVMPAGFDPPRFDWLGAQDLWFPLAGMPQNRGWGRSLLVVARLRGGVTMDQAASEMQAIAQERAREDPANRDWSVSVNPLALQLTGAVRTTLFTILGAAMLLLAVAATNVATLTLSLMRRRAHELEIRRAIGATDRRLFRQLFTQSALLGGLGAVTGLLMAIPATRLLLTWLPAELPRLSSIQLDATVLSVSASAALLATCFFAAASGIRARRHGAASLLARAATHRITTRRPGAGMVIAEIALGVTLTFMAVLMLRSFASLKRVDLGFTPNGVVVARIALPAARYASTEQQTAFFATLLERVRAMPGVQSAGTISGRPFGGNGPATRVSDPRSPQPVEADVVADVRWADTGYFRAMNIRQLSGRSFQDAAMRGRTPEVVINESLARRLWPGTDPLGRPLFLVLFDGITAQVVGVVEDVHLIDARTQPRATAYLSAAQFPITVRDLVVRTDGAPEQIVPSLRAVTASLERSLPLYAVTTMSRLVGASLARDRIATIVLGAFAIAALALASVGVFGVCSGEMAGRRKEIGVRMALGARGSEVVAMFLRQAAGRIATGIAIGSLMAALIARGMSALLFGVQPYDAGVFAAVAAIVVVVAAAATLVPALRAVRDVPLGALREG